MLDFYVYSMSCIIHILSYNYNVMVSAIYNYYILEREVH